MLLYKPTTGDPEKESNGTATSVGTKKAPTPFFKGLTDSYDSFTRGLQDGFNQSMDKISTGKFFTGDNGRSFYTPQWFRNRIYNAIAPSEYIDDSRQQGYAKKIFNGYVRGVTEANPEEDIIGYPKGIADEKLLERSAKYYSKDSIQKNSRLYKQKEDIGDKFFELNTTRRGPEESYMDWRNKIDKGKDSLNTIEAKVNAQVKALRDGKDFIHKVSNGYNLRDESMWRFAMGKKTLNGDYVVPAKALPAGAKEGEKYYELNDPGFKRSLLHAAKKAIAKGWDPSEISKQVSHTGLANYRTGVKVNAKGQKVVWYSDRYDMGNPNAPWYKRFTAGDAADTILAPYNIYGEIVIEEATPLEERGYTRLVDSPDYVNPAYGSPILYR